MKIETVKGDGIFGTQVLIDGLHIGYVSKMSDGRKWTGILNRSIGTGFRSATITAHYMKSRKDTIAWLVSVATPRIAARIAPITPVPHDLLHAAAEKRDAPALSATIAGTAMVPDNKSIL